MTSPSSSDELLRRLEVVCLRLERVLEGLVPPVATMAPEARSGPVAPAGEVELAGELAPFPQVSQVVTLLTDPTPEDLEAAEHYIEAAKWRAETFLRKIEAQGGPTEEDVEAYIDAWTTHG